MDAFYPGDEYVDWIGADGYDRQQLGAAAFTAQFDDWYTMSHDTRQADDGCRETARRPTRPNTSAASPRCCPGDFPEIKALVSFNAAGDIDWRLGSYKATGLAAFAELGRRPYFATMPAP